MLLELLKFDFTGPTRPMFFTGKPIQNLVNLLFCIGFPVKNIGLVGPVKEGAKKRLSGGCLFFRAAFGRTWVPHPFSVAHGYTPQILDDHLVFHPPIPDELLPSPHFPKYIFFKKCLCVSRHFYINQKDMMLLSLRYFVIEYLLFEWLEVQTNWFGWVKP